MLYEAVVSYPKGNSLRLGPSIYYPSIFIKYPFGKKFYFSELVKISDVEEWAKVDGFWMALKYPGSQIIRAKYWEVGSVKIPEKLMRVKNDWEMPPYTARVNLPSWKNPKMRQAPEVYPMYLTPSKNSSGGRVNIQNWEKFIYENINNGKNKWNYYVNPHSGLFNQAGWPKLEQIIMGNNLVSVLDIQNGFAKIDFLRVDVIPDFNLYNQFRTPWFFQKFNVVTKNNILVNPNPGVIYSPIIQRYGKELWIPMTYLTEVQYDGQ